MELHTLKAQSGISGFRHTLWLVKKVYHFGETQSFLPFYPVFYLRRINMKEGQYWVSIIKKRYKTLHMTMEEVKMSCDPIINFLCNWEQIFILLVIENTCFSREELKPYDQRKPLNSIYYYF